MDTVTSGEDDFFNPSEEWQTFVRRFEPVIRAIASKATTDEDLRSDVQQEARVALATIRPERITKANKPGVRPEQRALAIDTYCRNVIRNSIYSYLQSYKTGPWDCGRTTSRMNPKTGEKTRIHRPSRYASLDQLESFGAQVDEDGNLSWAVDDDGLLDDSSHENSAHFAALRELLDVASQTEMATPALSTPRAHTAPEPAPELETPPQPERTPMENTPTTKRRRTKRRTRRVAPTPAPIPEPVTPTLRAGLGIIGNAIRLRARRLVTKLRALFNRPAKPPVQRQAPKKAAKTKTPFLPMTKPPRGPDPLPRDHGHVRTYRSGCRCDLCREANAEQARRWRRKPPSEKTARNPDDFRHGTTHAYRRHKCRCEACVTAMRECNQRSEANRQAKRRANAA